MITLSFTIILSASTLIFGLFSLSVTTGCSIGCVFLANYCIKHNLKIGKCIFVSGCNNYYFLENFDNINKYMYTDEIKKFINLCDERICIYSKDDPYIKIEALQDFSNSIKAKTIVYDHAGHFNEKSGYLKFEDLLILL